MADEFALDSTLDALLDDLRHAIGLANACGPSPWSWRSTSATHRCSTPVGRRRLLPASTAEVQACVRTARRHGRAVRPPGLGHRASPAARSRWATAPIPSSSSPPRWTGSSRSTPRRAWRGSSPASLNLDLARAVAPHRPALRARPVEPAGVLDRRQRRQQLGRAALPRLRRHQRARAGRRGRAARRRGRDARRPRPRARRLRPAGCVRRQRGHAGHRHPHRGAADPDPARRRAPCCSTSRSVDAAAAAVSGIIAAGHRPGRARDDGRADHPRRRGLRPRGLPARRRRRPARRGRRAAGRASTDGRRRVIERRPGARRRPRCGWRPTRPSGRCSWKGRKSAFGAIARIAPNYYLHDTVVPRTKLVEVLTEIYAIAADARPHVMNVFHAGDGNLHPLLVFDAREPGVIERVHAAGDEIVEACVDAGGVLSGEHGIGLEKRDFMPLLFSRDDLDAQARLRDAFDPDDACQPAEGPARRARAAATSSPSPRGRGSDGTGRGAIARPSPSEVRRRRARSCRRRRARRSGTSGGAARGPARRAEVRGTGRHRRASNPAEMTVRVRRRHHRGRPRRGARRARPDVRRSPDCAGRDRRRRARGRAAAACAGSATARCATRVLEVRFVTADGRVVKAGGPTVKNVTGYDLCRLLVGSLGTLGCIGEVVAAHACPRPRCSEWVCGEASTRSMRCAALHRPPRSCGTATTTWVLPRGPRRRRDRPGSACSGVRPRSTGRRALPRAAGWSLRPIGAPTAAGAGGDDGPFVAEIGVGIVHTERPAPARAPSTRRRRAASPGARRPSTRPAG